MKCPNCFNTTIDHDDISDYNTCLLCGEFWSDDSIEEWDDGEQSNPEWIETLWEGIDYV